MKITIPNPTANNITPAAPTGDIPGMPNMVANPNHPAENDMRINPTITIRYGLFIFPIFLDYLPKTSKEFLKVKHYSMSSSFSLSLPRNPSKRDFLAWSFMV